MLLVEASPSASISPFPGVSGIHSIEVVRAESALNPQGIGEARVSRSAEVVLRFTFPAGESVQVETSKDLRVWTAIEATMVPLTDTVYQARLARTDEAHRFFRLTLVPIATQEGRLDTRWRLESDRPASRGNGGGRFLP
jgi:hypothetical protein